MVVTGVVMVVLVMHSMVMMERKDPIPRAVHKCKGVRASPRFKECKRLNTRGLVCTRAEVDTVL